MIITLAPELAYFNLDSLDLWLLPVLQLRHLELFELWWTTEERSVFSMPDDDSVSPLGPVVDAVKFEEKVSQIFWENGWTTKSSGGRGPHKKFIFTRSRRAIREANYGLGKDAMDTGANLVDEADSLNTEDNMLEAV